MFLSKVFLTSEKKKTGQTYERHAIEEWLKHHAESPLTRQKMTVKDLIPNIALRKTIQNFLSEHPDMKDMKRIKLDSEVSRKIDIDAHVLPGFFYCEFFDFQKKILNFCI